MTNGDLTQMDRLFRRSNRYRDKWDEFRGSLTYGENTIRLAVSGLSEETNTLSAESRDGQILLLDCGSYRADSTGIYLPLPGSDNELLVCSHLIAPVGLYVNSSDGSERIDLAYCRDGVWRHRIVSKTDLYNTRNIVNLCEFGISVSTESARQLVKFLQFVEDRNRDMLPCQVTHSHLGWNRDYTQFIPYAQDCVYDMAGDFSSEFRFIISQAGKLAAWTELMRPIRTDQYLPARLTVAASFASVLVKPMSCLPFILNLWSPSSGNGKSVALMAAASVWGDPALEGGYIKSMNATNVALEQYAAFCGNLPGLLDELQTIQGQHSFDDKVYQLCEGMPKSRGAKNGGLRAQTGWRNTFITNGEQPIISDSSKAGSINRVIEVECIGMLFPGDLHALCLGLERNHGHAGRFFVSYLSQPEHMESARELYEQYRTDLTALTTGKQANSAALLLTADHLVTSLIFRDDRQLTVDDIARFLKTENQVDTGVRTHSFVLEWITANKARFADDCGQTRYGCMTSYNGRDACAIFPAVLDNALRERQFSLKSYLSWAAERDLIGIEDRAHKQPKISFPGTGRIRCVVVFIDLQQERSFPF